MSLLLLAAAALLVVGVGLWFDPIGSIRHRILCRRVDRGDFDEAIKSMLEGESTLDRLIDDIMDD